MKLIKKELVPAPLSLDRRLPKIIKLKKEGKTFKEISSLYGVSRQRIQQILARKDNEIVLYIYECPKCKLQETRYRQASFTCTQCFLAKTHKKVASLSKIYINEPEWRKEGREKVRFSVRFRDNFTCQDCKKVRTPEEVRKHNKKIKTMKGKIKLFDVHHLNGLCGKKSTGYDKTSETDSLITLCHKCHYNHPDHTIQQRKKLLTV